MQVPEPSRGRITPLWIVAAFLTLTELAVNVSITQTQDGVQIALTVFAIVYALLVFAAFFLVLWFRPYVFYPPSDYPNSDPQKFVDAMRGPTPVTRMVEQQAELIRLTKEEPENTDAKFELINPLVEDNYRQFIILMHDQQVTFPFESFFGDPGGGFEIARTNSWSHGTMSARNMAQKLSGTGFLEIDAEGPNVVLTPLGHEYARWLIDNGFRADYLFTAYGGWGVPVKFPHETELRHDKMRQLDGRSTPESASQESPPTPPIS